MVDKIIIAGSGGQGIMLLGKILAESAMREGKFVTWLPAYGPEVRGGTAHCMVVVSDRQISSPYIQQADVLIAMNAPSLSKFRKRLKPGGLLLANTSLAECKSAKNTVGRPFTDIALKLGNIKVANVAALGCFLSANKAVKISTVTKVIADFAPKGRDELITINQMALKEGARL